MLTAFIAASVLAQAPTPPPLVEAGETVKGAPADAITAVKFASKMTVGVGSFQGGNSLSTGDGTTMISLLGVEVRLGWQFTEQWGFQVEGAVGTSGFTSVTRGAAFFTFTPDDWFTFGAGGAAATNYAHEIALFGTSQDYQSSYAAAVARIDFHVISSRNESGGRRAFDVGVELEAGQSVDGPGANGIGAYLTMGFVYW